MFFEKIDRLYKMTFFSLNSICDSRFIGSLPFLQYQRLMLWDYWETHIFTSFFQVQRPYSIRRDMCFLPRNSYTSLWKLFSFANISLPSYVYGYSWYAFSQSRRKYSRLAEILWTRCSPREIHKKQSRIAAVNSQTVDKTRAGRMRRVI